MIKAEMVAASINAATGQKIATMKVVMPRYILAEFNTHRVFSRNSASSRAIPFAKMVKSVKENPFVPIAWQKDHKGMQGTKYFTTKDQIALPHPTLRQVSDVDAPTAFTELWSRVREEDILHAEFLNRKGLTKQMANRRLEADMYHTVLITATEFENFFNLRCPQYAMSDVADTFYKSKKSLMAKHGPGFALLSEVDWLQMNKGQADIHMMALAEAMYDCYNEAEFKELQPGNWHLPFGDQIDGNELIAAYEKEFGSVGPHTGNLYHFLIKRICIARCARLSYETLGDTPKIDFISDLKLFEGLSKNGHFSPFEHVCKAMSTEEHEAFVKTIIDKDGNPIQQKGWCANFRDFIQFRSFIEN